MGASIGREAAPKLMGGAVRQRAGRWARLSRAAAAAAGGLRGRRRAGRGLQRAAGRGAVHRRDPDRQHQPAGGAAGAGLLGDRHRDRLAVPARPRRPTWTSRPTGSRAGCWSGRCWPGRSSGWLAAGYIRLIGWVSHHRATGCAALIAPLAAFGVLGLSACVPAAVRQRQGHGADAFLGIGSIGLLLALFVLKPLVTALCLGSGASGGLFTPTLSTGAVLGGAARHRRGTWLWPGSPSARTRWSVRRP